MRRCCGDVRFNSLGELAGTNLTLNYAVKNIIEHTGVSLPEAFRMASLNPARLLKLDRDKKANLILFSEDLDVVRVLWEGDWI